MSKKDKDAKSADGKKKSGKDDKKAEAREAPAGLAKYERVRANVPRRRKMYGWFILLAIVVFVTSAVDIVYLDEMLFWGVVGAYVLLFVWAIILFFASVIPVDEWHLQKAALRCIHCKSIFSFSEDHYKDSHAMVTCPICAEPSHLPGRDDRAVVLPIPAQPDHRAAYQCGNCMEHLLIGTFKKAPKGVKFSECPNCGVSGEIRPLKETARIDESPILGTLPEDEPLPEGEAEFDVGAKPKASAA